jgi:hypothetical protein
LTNERWHRLTASSANQALTSGYKILSVRISNQSSLAIIF